MTGRDLKLPGLALLAALLLAGCGDDGLLRAGGEYSGVPDLPVGDYRHPLGRMSTGGTIILNREEGWR